MSEHAGFPINWALSTGKGNISTHPLYIKYAYTPLGVLLKADVQTDLAEVSAKEENQWIMAYLTNLIRTLIVLEAI